MPLELSVGARVAGRFELEAPTGELGLGDVWSASDRGGPLGAVSVSLLGSPSPDGPTSRVAFDETVARLRALSNPGLATVLAGGEHDGQLWLATERLEGRTLANWIEGWRQIEALPTFGAVQRVVDRLCTTLQFAHGASGAPMLHRGLNPRSVLLRRTGPGPHLVKLVDLGVAPFAFADGGASRQWAWMAPEQLPQPAMPPRWNEGPAADVFSLAVMTVELLTGTPLPSPDGRETWATRARAPGVDLVAALASLRSDVPRAVWEVLGRSLASSPRARPQSVQQLQRALREAWQSSGEWDRSSANDPDPPMPSAVPPPPRPASPAGSSAASAISGWRSAERVAEPTAAPVKPAVQYGATMRTPRGMVPTERAPHAPLETPAAQSGTAPDPTEYVNLGAASLWSEGPPTAHEGTQALDLSVAQALFGESLPDDAPVADAPEVGTQVMSRPFAPAPQPPPPQPPAPLTEPPRDVREETQAIDLDTAFAGAEGPLGGHDWRSSIAGESDPFSSPASGQGYTPLTTMSPQRGPAPPSYEPPSYEPPPPPSFDPPSAPRVSATPFAPGPPTPPPGYPPRNSPAPAQPMPPVSAPRGGFPGDDPFAPMKTMAMPTWQTPPMSQPSPPPRASTPTAPPTDATPRWMIYAGLALLLVILAAGTFLYLRLR